MSDFLSTNYLKIVNIYVIFKESLVAQNKILGEREKICLQTMKVRSMFIWH